MGQDPERKLPVPAVTVTLGGTPTAAAPPFSVTIVILPYAASPPPATIPGESGGTVQLIAYWDGRAWHRGLHTWTGSAWSLGTDIAATGLTIQAQGSTVTLYWDGLGGGARYGEWTASSAGCTTHDISASLVPLQTYTG
jgi:hypothetical protein